MEAEDAGEALLVQVVRAADAVRQLPMLRRTGSRFHRLLPEPHRKPEVQHRPRVEQVPQVDLMEEADVEPHAE